MTATALTICASPGSAVVETLASATWVVEAGGCADFAVEADWVEVDFFFPVDLDAAGFGAGAAGVSAAE